MHIPEHLNNTGTLVITLRHFLDFDYCHTLTVFSLRKHLLYFRTRNLDWSWNLEGFFFLFEWSPVILQNVYQELESCSNWK